jgi:hypothetical protein
MAEENEHIKTLVDARESEVGHRREVASGLAEKHQRGHVQDMREAIIQIQNAIEAIDRAIADEKLIASSVSRGV